MATSLAFERAGMKDYWTLSITGVFVGLLLALVIPIMRLSTWMRELPYYEHTPFLAIAAIGLAIYRFRKVEIELTLLLSARSFAWLIISICLTAAVYILPSRWMAAPALITGIAAALNFYGGRRLAITMRGPLLLLIACTPLPVQMDNWFVLQMQQLATVLASLWLDLMGVLHLSTGVDIRTATTSYIVEDACSGIHSMFAAIAVSVGYGIMRNYKILRVFILVFLTVLWVTVANALRVFLIVYGQAKWDMDLTSGWSHELLGMATFAVGILLAMSSDQFLRYLKPVSTIDELPPLDMVNSDNRERFWNRPISLRIAGGAIGSLAIVAVVGVLLFSNFSRLSAGTRSIETLAKSSVIDFDVVGKDFLPAEMAGWKMTGFEIVEKGEDSIFGGMRSFVWQYSVGARDVLVSVDGPYNDWHDLAICYSGVGWNIEKRETLVLGGKASAFQAADLRMVRPPLDIAHVLFVCFDPQGKSVDPPPHFGDAMVHFINRFRWALGEKQDYGGGVIQVQLLDQTPVNLSTLQQDQNRQLLETVIGHAFGEQPPT